MRRVQRSGVEHRAAVLAAAPHRLGVRDVCDLVDRRSGHHVDADHSHAKLLKRQMQREFPELSDDPIESPSPNLSKVTSPGHEEWYPFEMPDETQPGPSASS